MYNAIEESELNILNLPYDSMPVTKASRKMVFLSLLSENTIRRIDKPVFALNDDCFIFSSIICLLYRYTGLEHFSCIKKTNSTKTEFVFRIEELISLELLMKSAEHIFQSIDDDANFLISIENVAISYCWNDDMLPDENERDIYFIFKHKMNQCSIGISYNQEVFHESTIKRMAANYLELIQSLRQEKNIDFRTCNMISNLEKELLNQFFILSDYPKKTIVQQFQARCEENPDKIALIYENQSYSYRLVDIISSQIAQYIVEKNIIPKTPVVIMLERSAEMVISILAVLKAGCAYVPIDLSFPDKRKQYILQDCNPSLIITVNRVAKECEIILNSYEMILLDKEKEKIQKCSSTLPDIQCSIDDIAYIIYTSGSTGNPKGTLLSHRGVSNLVSWDFLGIQQESRVLQFASFCFDASVLATFCALLRGATLVVAAKEITYDINALIGLLREKRITFVLLSPSLISQIPLDTDFYLDTLIAGGEVCPSYLAEEWSKRLNFINLYGPTETTVCVTGWSSKQEKMIPKKLPIGKPLPNVKIYIIDKNDNLVPIGVNGEICIEGPMLADGYLNNPEVTQKHFVHFPFSDRTVYRTGDIGRYLPDGNIEFDGRADSQIKIRGFRIEIGEIETVLMQHPQIKEAAAIPIGTGPETMLAAFVVSEGNISKKDIWNYLDEQLPSYMKPSVMTILPCLPKTVSGKIDRKALKTMETSETELRNTSTDNLTELQKVLCSIWESVLHRKVEDIESNFFENGGHSLKIVELASKIKQHFNVFISVKELYNCLTIKELEQWLIEHHSIISLSNENERFHIPRMDPGNVYPLSMSQWEILNACNLTQNKTLYNIVACYEVHSHCTSIQIKDYLDIILSRHSALRSRLQIIEDDVYQVVSKNPVSIIMIQVKDDFEFNQVVQKEFFYEFDLYKGPLSRFLIIEQNEKQYLLINVHHIIFDGCSLQILLQDLEMLIEKQEWNKNVLSYGNCVLWKNNLLNQKSASYQSFWKQEFGKNVSELKLPYDFNRSGNHSGEGKLIQYHIDMEITRKLKEKAAKLEVSEFSILLSALTVTIHYYTRQDNILIGTTISGRTSVEEQNVIGMFVNTLPVIAHFNENQSLQDVICALYEKLTELMDYQDFSFQYFMDEQAKDMLNRKQGIFQVVCSQEDRETNEHSIFQYVELDNNCYHTAKFDLTFSIGKIAQSTYQVNVEYNTELFAEPTIHGIFENYLKILEIMLTDSTMSLENIYQINKIEDFLVDRETKDKVINKKTIKDVFEMIAEQYADRVALSFKGQALTYRKLNNRANFLAYQLLEKGLNPEKPVLILAERSFELVIGVLATVKAGGIYVVIDASYPKERIAYIMEHSRARYLLCQNEMLKHEEVTTFQGCKIILDEDEDSQEQDIENPRTNCNLESPLYIIYTSGSTGRPKGVVVSNCNVLRLMKVTKDLYNFNQNDIWTLFHSMSFDFSVWEMYGALLYGGKLVIVPRITAQNPVAFLNLIYQEKVTVLNQTPSAFFQLLEQELERKEHTLDDHLRYVIFGGESLNPAKLKKWYKLYEKRPEMVNMYGITETTVHSTYRLMKPDDVDRHLMGSPIGKPLSDLTILLLDANRHIVPNGTVGEIYITGDGVAKGYLFDEQKTEEVFLEPILDGIKGRWYKTGDLARYGSQGELEYMGRADEQVKIRGFRIELKEIESVIVQNEHVNNAVVITDKDDTNEPFIIAFAETDRKISEKELNEYLRNYLPDYMIPSSMIFVKEIPLTHNGKVDKKALTHASVQKNIINENLTEMEEKVITIWKTMLKKEQISKKDDFFDIGGHSLRILELIHQIKKVFQVELSYRDIFQNSIAEQLAKKLEEESEQGEKYYVYELDKDGENVTVYQSAEDVQLNGIPDEAENIRIIYDTDEE